MNKISLLLVDDHAVVRAGYRQLIAASERIQIIGECESAEKACQLYLELTPDVVVMDLGLPGMSGLEGIRRIVGRDPAASVLAFTIHDELIYLKRVLEAGAKGYLRKSCEPDLLLKGVELLSQGRQFIDPFMANKLAESDGMAGGKSREGGIASLSPREFDIYCLLVKGQTSQQISKALSLSQKTVANYTTQIKTKLGVKTAAELVHLAGQQGALQ